jgi:hypothetical protein
VFEDFVFNFDYLKSANRALCIRSPIYKYHAYDALATQGARIVECPLGYKPALDNIRRFLELAGVPASVTRRETGHACVAFAIRVLLRLHALRPSIERARLRRIVAKIIDDGDIRRNLRYYSPTGCDSRVLPVLMRLRLVGLLLWVCRYKTREVRRRGGVTK